MVYATTRKRTPRASRCKRMQNANIDIYVGVHCEIVYNKVAWKKHRNDLLHPTKRNKFLLRYLARFKKGKEIHADLRIRRKPFVIFFTGLSALLVIKIIRETAAIASIPTKPGTSTSKGVSGSRRSGAVVFTES